MFEFELDFTVIGINEKPNINFRRNRVSFQFVVKYIKEIEVCMKIGLMRFVECIGLESLVLHSTAEVLKAFLDITIY